MLDAQNLWPHQAKGIEETRAHIESGVKSICLTTPTGGGKTKVMSVMIQDDLDHNRRCIIYTHRRLLVDQSSLVLQDAGIDHGVRASGHATHLYKDVQIATIQTEDSRTIRKQVWDLHDADRVYVDEAHNQTSATARKIIQMHRDAGAVIIGLTATPVGLGGIYDQLVIAGTNSELRACGAHLICHTYAPDEPDLKHIHRNAVGEYSENDIAKRIMVQSVFGRVRDNLIRINPELRPTILFAPGVPESRWFSEELSRLGIPSAHIDASTPDDERKKIMEASRRGDIKVLCNRFVLREGWDAPWISHCIFATAFGALSNFLQAGGRLLRRDRNNPTQDYVTLQDHGGNWHRHGSLNANREWMLGDTDISITKDRPSLPPGEPEPIVCPKCSAIRKSGIKCPKCGHEHKRSVRIVVQVDGKLKRMLGNVHKPPKSAKLSQDERVWNSVLYACANAKTPKNLRQARYLFKAKTGRWPAHDLPHMPPHPPDHTTWTSNVDVVCPWMKRKRS